MKLVRSLSMFLALAGASTVYADTAKAPAEKKAPDKPAAGAKAELGADDVAKVERFVNDLVDAVVKNQDACPKMGPAINGVFDRNEALLRRVTESGKDMPQASKDKFAKRQGEMISGIMKCKDDPGVNGALNRLAALTQRKPDAKPAPAPEAKPAPAPAAPAKK